MEEKPTLPRLYNSGASAMRFYAFTPFWHTFKLNNVKPAAL